MDSTTQGQAGGAAKLIRKVKRVTRRVLRVSAEDKAGKDFRADSPGRIQEGTTGYRPV
jgi:hypothetical protein